MADEYLEFIRFKYHHNIYIQAIDNEDDIYLGTAILSYILDTDAFYRIDGSLYVIVSINAIRVSSLGLKNTDLTNSSHISVYLSKVNSFKKFPFYTITDLHINDKSKNITLIQSNDTNERIDKDMDISDKITFGSKEANETPSNTMIDKDTNAEMVLIPSEEDIKVDRIVEAIKLFSNALSDAILRSINIGIDDRLSWVSPYAVIPTDLEKRIYCGICKREITKDQRCLIVDAMYTCSNRCMVARVRDTIETNTNQYFI